MHCACSWIEPPEGSAYLRGVHSIESGPAEFATSLEGLTAFADRLWMHFGSHATVIMIDDSIKAYAVAGIAETVEAVSFTEGVLSPPWLSLGLSLRKAASMQSAAVIVVIVLQCESFALFALASCMCTGTDHLRAFSIRSPFCTP